MAGDGRLDGWKAIANFLGRDRTTAIRWTTERGLPVHRVPGGRTGTVYALPAELDAWLANGAATSPPVASVPPPTASLPRRELLTGGALIAGVAMARIGAWRSPSAVESPAPQPSAPLGRGERMMNQAQLAFTQYSREGQSQAFGLLQRVVAEQPGYADGWGSLAMVYACSAHWRSTAEAENLRARARAAAARAEALDPGNAYAAVARANIAPTRGNWLATERALRRAMALHPAHEWPPFALGVHLQHVGRNRESAAIFERLRRRREPNPALYQFEIVASWSANRLEETERLTGEAAQLYPSHFGIWFARLFIRLHADAAAALAIIEDVAGRPTGVPSSEFAAIAAVIRAVTSRAAGDADAAMRVWLAMARAGNGYAESTIQFAAALGRIDDAYRLIHAFYFNRGLSIPDVRYTVELGAYSPLDERQTAFLFWPSLAPVRRDPRFAALTRELGLDRYWRDSGRRPDV